MQKTFRIVVHAHRATFRAAHARDDCARRRRARLHVMRNIDM